MTPKWFVSTGSREKLVEVVDNVLVQGKSLTKEDTIGIFQHVLPDAAVFVAGYRYNRGFWRGFNPCFEPNLWYQDKVCGFIGVVHPQGTVTQAVLPFNDYALQYWSKRWRNTYAPDFGVQNVNETTWWKKYEERTKYISADGYMDSTMTVFAIRSTKHWLSKHAHAWADCLHPVCNSASKALAGVKMFNAPRMGLNGQEQKALSDLPLCKKETDPQMRTADGNAMFVTEDMEDVSKRCAERFRKIDENIDKVCTSKLTVSMEFCNTW